MTANEDDWTISLMGNVVDAYYSEREALRFAIEAARDAGVRGHRAEVLVRDRGNCLRNVWIFGIDPFPPPEFTD
ncbi:hypothetical protein [Hyphomicrobium sp. LHD-15]|uniref:hypothetical protein n=1 Tax=Hyphomicrobium sp. LHD-15 TaxID=3072142 RepID=UPI00280D4BAD|nr:hypothetical protein [Hyphomicrobium sp. LHD-15]MDQ8700852.1 hypothetical protein [Hyphomicrobium sp. LHD-15]